MMRSSIILLAGILLPVTRSQFIPPPTDLTEAVGYADIPLRYKEVPSGICELDPGVRSYSGYADVGNDQHIFWWFFEKRGGDPTTAPLTVWINGGPGSSSMIGLFQELGPCGVDYFGDVYDNPYSWTTLSNVLFIDQPNQVGFSYSQPIPAYKSEGDVIALPEEICPEYAKKCGTYSYPNLTLTANSTINAAPNFWKTLQGFTGVFPQYSRNGIVMATESYGGHYGPVFAAYIERQNELRHPGTHEIPLKGLMVGNGWFDPIINYQAFYNFSINPGNTYDLPAINKTTHDILFNNIYGPGNCLDQLNECKQSGVNAICSKADSFCASHVEQVYYKIFDRDPYDIRYLKPDPFPYSFFQDYLNTAEVQKAIGAYTNYSSNGAVWMAFSGTGDDARDVDTIQDMRYLLSRGITVAIYAGDADSNCNWLGDEAVAEEVAARGFDTAGYADLQTSDGITHGQVKQAGLFSFTRVYESGHMVPFYQPLAGLALLNRTLHGLDIETGNQVVSAGYLTKGSPKSTHHQGNATVQWEVTPRNLTYNITTNRPGNPWMQKPSLPYQLGADQFLDQHPLA
ncbi:Alpha/Beta hydrolase protein [Xylariales sp. PMI_506]|nr:Alpha/Beta hydrolase protein [Xylariales sp. PMI_506]